MKNTKIIPLTSNTMFKELFGRIENKDILSFFLSNYLDIEYNLVYDNIVHLNTSLKIDNIKDYKYNTDIIVTLNDVVINLEMNKTFWKGIENRNFSYITGLIGKQYISGKGKNQFKKINKHIQINLNNYNNPRNRKVQILKLKDIETNEELELLEIHNVNLEVIKEECYNKDVNELTKLEKVSKFLLSENSEELKGVIGDMDEILDKVMDLCND
ncbi:MAG: PD-(D/E)XK nuclease family transposase, partial [Bacilli bacterium]|nr:PD-(D/E)XK nuclease family transposase [Bacilli bacterium]